MRAQVVGAQISGDRDTYCDLNHAIARADFIASVEDDGWR
jgi:hypothetical protein